MDARSEAQPMVIPWQAERKKRACADSALGEFRRSHKADTLFGRNPEG
jgi:hypothetical protein